MRMLTHVYRPVARIVLLSRPQASRSRIANKYCRSAAGCGNTRCCPTARLKAGCPCSSAKGNRAVAEDRSYDVAVIGAGPAGLTAALLAARGGLSTICFSGATQPAERRDPRTTALMQGAVRLLDNLGLWQSLKDHCAPLTRLRLIDDTDWSVKAPSVLFDANELGDEPFGWNIPNQNLIDALAAATAPMECLHLIAQDAKRIEVSSGGVSIVGHEGATVQARLVIAADGRNSIGRDAAGISADEWSYPQIAIACSFSHALPHDDTSIEFHKSAGPLTLVPLPDHRSSLVWVARPQEAEELSALEALAFEHRLYEETHGVLGGISGSTRRGTFEIKGLTARRFASDRIALIGEAAHVLPPIGAQGLNLGLRDAALISELAVQASTDGLDIADDSVLDSYDRRRRLDVLPRTALVDFLNRSLFSGLLPLQGLRGLGLFMLDTVGPLRRAVMRQGMEPQTNLPKIMQRRSNRAGS